MAISLPLMVPGNRKNHAGAFYHRHAVGPSGSRKAEPPVIIATSTNNQAVTNIIEAFGKDFSQGTGAMAGRWLPELKSFGAYFPSSTRKAEAAKNIKLKISSTRLSQKSM